MIVGKENVDPTALPHRITSHVHGVLTFRPLGVLRTLPIRGCTLRHVVFGISVSQRIERNRRGRKYGIPSRVFPTRMLRYLRCAVKR